MIAASQKGQRLSWPFTSTHAHTHLMPLDNLLHTFVTGSALRHSERGRLDTFPRVLPATVLRLRDARIRHNVHALVPFLGRAGRYPQALGRVRVALGSVCCDATWVNAG